MLDLFRILWRILAVEFLPLSYDRQRAYRVQMQRIAAGKPWHRFKPRYKGPSHA